MIRTSTIEFSSSIQRRFFLSLFRIISIIGISITTIWSIIRSAEISKELLSTITKQNQFSLDTTYPPTGGSPAPDNQADETPFDTASDESIVETSRTTTNMMTIERTDNFPHSKLIDYGFLTTNATMMKDDNIFSKPSVGDGSSGGGAAICAIQKGGIPYIDEWVDYNIALGFEKIYIYDNSDDFELKEWLYMSNDDGNDNNNRHNVIIKHYPGIAKQMRAYTECGKFIKHETQHSWIAFIDLDEFIVLRDAKKYPHIMDLLNTMPDNAGALVANWYMFHFNNQTKYEPKPVLLRFQGREPDPNIHIKTIARADVFKSVPNPHFIETIVPKRYRSIDTNENAVKGPFNENLTNDTIVIFHMYTKSVEEYKTRCKRGTASMPREKSNKKPSCKDLTDEEFLKFFGYEPVIDDIAWRFLKERVPKYARFEEEN